MTEPMTPERLRLIRVVHEKFCEWCEQQMDCPVADLLAEVERLQAENKRAMECFDRDQKVIADLKAAVDRLQAQVAAVEKVREKYKRNMKRLAGSMMLSYCDPYEVNRAAVRDLDAALASGDEADISRNGTAS